MAPDDPSGTPEDSFSPRETTQERRKLAGARVEGITEGYEQGKKLLVTVAAVLGAIGPLVAVIMYAVGRASSADLQVTDTRTIKIEQAHEDLVKTVETVKVDTDRRFDRFESKVDKIGENLYRMAVRAGVPASRPPPPAPPTIKPAPPEEMHR